jgi:shikimate kinase
VTPKAVLVGLPGTGKTTTGRRLAKILGAPFADSDELVEAATGRSVRALFAEGGEPAFRSAEQAAVAAALADFDGVLSLGGGALSWPATRAVVAGSGVPVVLLRATVDTLVGRVGDGHSRPLLAADPPGRLRALALERNADYEAVAELVVETDGRTPGQVAATIAARLHERKVQR